MQAQPNSGDFYTFAELQGLKKGDLVIFVHGYLNGTVAHLQPEFVWAFVSATPFTIRFANIARVGADGLSTGHVHLTENDYRLIFGNSARAPTQAEYRLAMRDRENIRVGAIEGRIGKLKRLAERFTFFDDLGPQRESNAQLVKCIMHLIGKYKRQRRLAMRRLRYRIRQTEEYPS